MNFFVENVSYCLETEFELCLDSWCDYMKLMQCRKLCKVWVWRFCGLDSSLLVLQDLFAGLSLFSSVLGWIAMFVRKHIANEDLGLC